MEQRSPDWFAARAGRLTASRVADAFARTKAGWGASRKNLIATLVCERLTGTSEGGFTSAAMQWGTDTEPQARAAYEFAMDVEVSETGFHAHPVIAMAGASPDGLIGSTGLVEIKCPNSATHIDTLRSETIADRYVQQMQWQMACTGREFCDFVSFDPRLPPEMQMWVRTVERDDARIAEMEAMAVEFLTEVDEAVEALTARYRGAAA